MSSTATVVTGSLQKPMDNHCKYLALESNKHNGKIGLCVESNHTWMTDITTKNKRKIQEALGLEIVDCKQRGNENENETLPVHNDISELHVSEEKSTDAHFIQVSPETKTIVAHHPDDDIDVARMKVVELREALRSRGLAATGRKAELQARFSAHLDDAREKRRLAAAANDQIEASSSESKKTEVNDSSSMIAIEDRRMSVDIAEDGHDKTSPVADEPDVKEDEKPMQIDVTHEEESKCDLQSTRSEATHFFDSMENDEGQNTSQGKAFAVDVKKAGDEDRVEAGHSNAPGTNNGKQEIEQPRVTGKSPTNKMMNIIKPITSMFSPRPTKNATNSIKGVKPNVNAINVNETVSSMDSITKSETSSSSFSKSCGSTRSSMASVISASSASSCLSTSYQRADDSSEFKKCSLNRDYAGSNTGAKSEQSTSIDSKTKSSAIKLSQAKSAIKMATEGAEERAAKQKARLEAMRGKARNEVLSASAVKEISATSKLVSQQAKEMLASSTKKAGATGNSRLPSATKTAALASLASAGEKMEKHRRLIAQMRERAQEKVQGQSKLTHAEVLPQKQQQTEGGGNSLKKIEEPDHEQQQKLNIQKQKQMNPRSPVPSLKKKMQSARSPMDTYEMSDREGSDSESDSESDSDDEAKPKKRVPNWARSVNLVAALEKQYSTGPDRIDPDTIFPEVESCNLEEIFDQRKTRYVRRTSSGNWTNDKVTTMEKLAYKRNMGFKAS